MLPVARAGEYLASHQLNCRRAAALYCMKSRFSGPRGANGGVCLRSHFQQISARPPVPARQLRLLLFWCFGRAERCRASADRRSFTPSAARSPFVMPTLAGLLERADGALADRAALSKVERHSSTLHPFLMRQTPVSWRDDETSDDRLPDRGDDQHLSGFFSHGRMAVLIRCLRPCWQREDRVLPGTWRRHVFEPLTSTTWSRRNPDGKELVQT